jgi:PAS domain S-box-containing protein
MEIWVIWHPTYWLSGTIKALTAVFSVLTAILLTRLVPKALQLPSQSTLKRAYAEVQTASIGRKRAEEDVGRLTLWYDNLLDTAPDAMVISDSSGRILLVNRQTEKLFGYSREELIGQPVEILVPSQFRDKHPAHRAEYMALPHTRAMGEGLDLLGLRRDNSVFPIEISLSPIETTARQTRLERYPGCLGTQECGTRPARERSEVPRDSRFCPGCGGHRRYRRPHRSGQHGSGAPVRSSPGRIGRATG